MECTLLKRFLDWVMLRQLFNDSYFDFLLNSNCTKTLKLFYSDIKQARLEKKCIIALKLDIHAAYNSSWWDDLIYKMASVGIVSNPALLIFSLIESRKIKVKWYGVFFHPIKFYWGMPQGSVFPPILFMSFLWDLFEAVDSVVQIIMYGNNIILYFLDFLLENVILKLQVILNRVNM